MKLQRSVSVFAPIALAMALMGSAPAQAAILDRVWIGGSNGTWSTPGNWSPGTVPKNSAINQYNVDITGGGSPIRLDAAMANTELNTLDLGAPGFYPELRLETGTSLTIVGTGTIYGILNGVGGHFPAIGGTSGPVDLAGCAARVHASAGSEIRIVEADGVLDSTCLWVDDGSAFGNLYSTNVITSSGAGSVVDLSGLASFISGFAPTSGNDTNHQYVRATAGGAIDLSGLSEAVAPVRGGDRLRFVVSDVGSSLLLTGLETASTSGAGYTAFESSAAAVLSLSSLSAATNSLFTASNGGAVLLPSLDSCSNALFNSASGGQISAPGPAPMTLAELGRWVDDGSAFGNAYSHELITAEGAGSVTDLSALTSLDSGFSPASGNDTNHHYVRASNGGAVDLSNLTQATSPDRRGDQLRFIVSGAASTLDLGALIAVGNAGSGSTSFEASAQATLSLPSLEIASDAIFSASTEGRIVAAGPSPMSLVELDRWIDDGSAFGNAYTTTLIGASGSNAEIDLSALMFIDSGIAPTSGNDTNIHRIAAGSGARVLLPSLERAIVPARSSDRLHFEATSGSELDASSLWSVDLPSNGLGYVDVDAGTSSTVRLGRLIGPSRWFTSITGSSLLDVGGDVWVTLPSTLVAAASTLELSGSFAFNTTVVTQVDLHDSIVRADGAGIQTIEVGGVDNDLERSTIPDTNFSFGQLEVGTPAQPTTVMLAEECNNGRRAGSVKEALYLHGVSGAGLRINAGSKLVLNGLHVYAWSDPAGSDLSGVPIHVPPGAANCWSYDQGQVCLLDDRDSDGDGVLEAIDNCPTVANATQTDSDGDFVGDVCDNCVAIANPRNTRCDLVANPWATLTGGQRDDDHDGYGNKCDAKFPSVAGSIVGAGDLAQFRASNGKNRGLDTCGTNGTRPCAIFDLDETIATIGAGDLVVMRSRIGKAPGPKCPTCPLTCEAGASGSCAP